MNIVQWLWLSYLPFICSQYLSSYSIWGECTNIWIIQWKIISQRLCKVCIKVKWVRLINSHARFKFFFLNCYLFVCTILLYRFFIWFNISWINLIVIPSSYFRQYFKHFIYFFFIQESTIKPFTIENIFQLLPVLLSVLNERNDHTFQYLYPQINTFNA